MTIFLHVFKLNGFAVTADFGGDVLFLAAWCTAALWNRECGKVGGTPTFQVHTNNREINQNHYADALPHISNTCSRGGHS